MMDFYVLHRENLLQFLREIGIIVTPLLLDIVALILLTTILYFVKPLKRLKTWFFIKRKTKYFDPYFHPEEINIARKYFINTCFQNIPPSYQQEPSNTHAVAARQELIPFFLEVFNKPENNNKYYIILADSGMGKTTFLINLYYKYKIKFFKKFEIFLFPLNSPFVEEHIETIPEDIKCKSIALFDALDEDGKAASNYVERIETLMQLTAKFRFVIITCRTQFFPFEEAEPSEIDIRKYGSNGEFHRFKKLYISPFTDANIKKYLWKKYSVLHIKKGIKAYKIVKASPYLMVRPMLLSYIDDLLLTKNELNNIYEIYYFLINAWIDREANRKKENERAAFKSALKIFSEKVAIKLYKNFLEDSNLSITGNKISHFAKENNIDLDELDLKSKSLLTRDAHGNYKFSHKSILEFFLAEKAFNDFDFLKTFQFQSFTYTRKIYRGLCKKRLLDDPLIQKNLITQTDAGRTRIVIDSPDAKLFQMVCGYPNILSLQAKGLRLSNDYLHYLKLIDELTLLDLSINNISDSLVIYSFSNLKWLNLSMNNLDDFFVKNLANLTYCDLSYNQLQEISLDSEKLENINLSSNPLQKIDIKNISWLEKISILNTKLTDIPNFPKGIKVLHDNDFAIFLNRTELIMKRKLTGEIKLPKGHNGIFNHCFATNSYCEYSYILKNDKKDGFEFINSVNISIVELVRKLLISESTINSLIKNTTNEQFTQTLRNGIIIPLQHDFFESIHLTIANSQIKLKVHLLPQN